MDKFSGKSRFSCWKALIVPCLLLTHSGLYSQTSEPLFRAGISVGPAFPIGKFGSTSTDSGSVGNGASKIGLAVQISLSYPIRHSQFAIILIAGWQENAINLGPAEKSLIQAFPNSTHIDMQSGVRNIWKFLAGPEWNIPVSADGRIRFRSALAAGILKTSLPWSSVAIDYGGMGFQYGKIESFSLPAVFCYQIQSEIGYRLNARMELTGDINFSHATPKHQYDFYLDPPVNSMPVHYSASYPISSLNVLFGIAYKF